MNSISVSNLLSDSSPPSLWNVIGGRNGSERGIIIDAYVASSWCQGIEELKLILRTYADSGRYFGKNVTRLQRLNQLNGP